MKSEKPVHFLILKGIGFGLLAIGLIVLIIGILKHVPEMGEKGWFEASSSKSTIITIGIMCCMISVPLFVMGFRPEIAKMTTKSAKYIQEQNKEDLKDIMANTGDIASAGVTPAVEESITKTVKAIKKGIKDTKFCTQCGKEIATDAKFCSHCGEKQ